MKRKVITEDNPDYLGMTILDVFAYLEQEFEFDFGEPYKIERIKNGIVICQECE